MSSITAAEMQQKSSSEVQSHSLIHRQEENLAVPNTNTMYQYLYLLSFFPVNCGVPRAPRNGTIENFQSISTVGGAQIVFRCDERFIPAGRMSATCVSADGISVDGTWTPNPADFVCNGEV